MSAAPFLASAAYMLVMLSGSLHSFFFFFTSSPVDEDTFIDFKEKGRDKEGGREININVRKKHQSAALCMCPDGGIKPTTLQSTERHSNQPSRQAMV